jgi:DNA-binding MarR family transcriptional regulator
MIEQSKSRGPKAALIEQLGGMVVRMQDGTQRYDEAVGEVYGLGSAERLCLSFLLEGPQTASAIARQIRLTPAAVTALIDRLEARGYVRRKPDPTDRRKVFVEMAEATLKLAREAYLPLQEAGAVNLGRYTEAELKLFVKFLGDSIAIQERLTREFLERHGKS